jgi:hypothetical protein
MNWKKLLTSIAVILVWGWLDFFLAITSRSIVAPLAGKQFDNSETSFIITQYGFHIFSFVGGALTVVALALLIFIWRREVAIIWKAIAAASLSAVLIAAMVSPANAYYSKDDYSEPYYILPNQSAFWVPDTGANKDTQAKLDSEAYYAVHKIAAKLFIIPHVKLPNSGLWSNYYVPAGRLYIVDRSPFNQEWTLPNRGTRQGVDEAFHCQTKEGLNVTAEVTVAASVHDADSPQFLFHFGVNPPQGNLTDPNVLFTSVLYSKSLTQIMDSVGKDAVGSIVCDEFSTRTFDQANADMAPEMTDIRKKAAALFSQWGITIDFLGWFGTFTFDDSVQKAIDNAYEARTIQPQLPTLEAYADITVKQGLAKGLAEHGLPANFLGISFNDIARFFGSAK